MLLVNDPIIINVAKRVTRNVVPLFYNMAKAGAVQLNSNSMFDGLMSAYTGGNIGTPSNDITKIWNSGEITEEKLKVVKWLCADVNFTIDYAKTLYKPTKPQYVNDLIQQYTNRKVPAFFKYAKQKEENQVEPESNSVVDRLHKLYPRQRLNFRFKKSSVGKFDYRMLMSQPLPTYNPKIVEEFIGLVSTLKFNKLGDDKFNNYFAVFDDVREKMRKLNYSDTEIVDNLVIYLFKEKRSSKKKAFWRIYGDLVYNNLIVNLGNSSAICAKCGKRFFKTRKNAVHCPVCTKTPTNPTRIISCIDCGTEFIASNKSNGRVRCNICRERHKRQQMRERQKRYRQNKGNVTHPNQV